ncbi:MAG: hypothetical protein K0R98_22 [Rickettsiaceae bacterium]|jgi:hypothetical protein|nr:hypothetical protein [Rickettsiaceae bacterium]
MKKLLINSALLGLTILSANAYAEDGEPNAAYDKAYSSCSEKADSAGDAYEEAFSTCMKEKGFFENEGMGKIGDSDSDAQVTTPSATQKIAPAKPATPAKK